MLVPALFSSAVAVSVALGVPERSPPAGHSVWIAVVTSDGNVQVSRDDGAPAIGVARCPVPPMRAEQDEAFYGPGPDGAGDEPDAGEDPLLVDFTWLPSPAAPLAAPGIALDTGDTGEAQDRAGPARSVCGLPGPPAQIAWRRDALYVACAVGPVYRWREDTGSWPVRLASRGAPDPDLPGPQAAPDRIVAMLGGAELRLADASRQLWLLPQDDENDENSEDDEDGLRHIGAVPEPVTALAEWQGALVAAGATAVWRRPDADAPWEPLVTIRACALSADRDSLWLAGPAGLVELTGQRVRVHALAPVTGIAVRDGDVWLASGRGPMLRAPVATAASVLLAGASRLAGVAPGGAAAGVMHGSWLRGMRARARRAHWLPEVVAQARWSRSHDGPGSTAITPIVPWPDQGPGSHAGELVLLLWLTWRLEVDHSAAAAARGVP
jgi:hypothetical protein